jgi:putative sugar O-methyltransferase
LAEVDFDPAQLSFPCVGNPAGIPVNGSIITIDTLRHAYHAAQMKKLLRGVERPVITEIGGGLGGQAFQSLRLCTGARYLIFDLPEVAVLSAYLLLTAFPEKRVCLFGEAPVTADFDMAVMPHFAVEELPARSVDLFYNSCSFSEMDAASAQAYLAGVERTCRGYFMHDNHDLSLEFRQADGELSRNIIGSELVPDRAQFRRLYKKPRAHRLPEDRGIPHFEYLYQRLD